MQYLARIFDGQELNKIKDVMDNKEVNDLTYEQYDRSLSAPSDEDIEYTTEANINRSKTMNAGTYFFVGDDIEEVLNSIRIFSKEDAIGGGMCGDDKPSMIMITLSDEDYDKFHFKGYIREFTGLYGSHQMEEQELREIIVYDKLYKAMIQNEVGEGVKIIEDREDEYSQGY